MVKQLLNGYQCEKCSTIHKTVEEAEFCEEQTLEEPLLKIGDTLIDDSYDVENRVRVYKIYYDRHEVCYQMEWQSPIRDGEWEVVYTIFGNEMLDDYFVIK